MDMVETVSYTHLDVYKRQIEDCIHDLIKLCTKILSDEPLFFLINSYTTGLAPAVLTYMPVSYTHLDVYKRQDRDLRRSAK